MGSNVSTASPVTPEGLGCVLHEQGGGNGAGPYRAGSVYSRQGGKSVNQDSAVLCQGYGTKDGIFCGVFDGHGKNGHKVSRIVRQRLPVLLLDKTNLLAEADGELDGNLFENQETSYDDFSSNGKFHQWEEACVNAFEEMDKEIKLIRNLDSNFSGTTAVVVMKKGEDLVIANLGDSRAVLGTKTEDGVKAVQLTTDLKPGSPGEVDRIRSSNGRVFALRDEPGVERAWLPRVHVPGIAMSRCFGDFIMKNYGLICTPMVTHHRITSDDLFVVLATDGIWDVLSNEEVTSVVSRVQSEELAAKAVVDAAAAAWKTRFPLAKPDDCTAVCLFFRKD